LWEQEGYWRMDSHRDEVYRCPLELCRGEAPALASLHGADIDGDNFSRTLTAEEREASMQLDTCRPGAKRVCGGHAVEAERRERGRRLWVQTSSLRPSQCAER